MQCPACGNTLTLMVVGEITLNVCEMGCAGIWFDNFELQKVDEPHESAGEELLQVGRKPDIVVDRTTRRMCPKCENIAMQQHFFCTEKEVEVDECPNCGGVWLDAGELATIRSQFDSDEERAQAAREYYEEVFGTQLAQMSAANEEKRQKARKFAHMFRFICPSYYVPGKQDWGAF